MSRHKWEKSWSCQPLCFRTASRGSRGSSLKGRRSDRMDSPSSCWHQVHSLVLASRWMNINTAILTAFLGPSSLVKAQVGSSRSLRWGPLNREPCKVFPCSYTNSSLCEERKMVEIVTTFCKIDVSIQKTQLIQAADLSDLRTRQLKIQKL